MQRLRILYVIDSLGYGGAEHSLVEILPEYRNRGVAVIVVCLIARDTTLMARTQASGVRVINAPRRGPLAQASWLHRLVKRLQPDAIHTTLFRADLVGRLASLGTGVPLITSLVNTQYGVSRFTASDIPRWKLRAVQEVERMGGRFFTDHFHVNSHAVGQAATDHLSVTADRMSVIPRGRDPKRFTPEHRASRSDVRAALGLAIEDDVILNIGRQEPQKGQVHLIRAFAKVRETNPRAHLLIVGGPGASSVTLDAAIRDTQVGNYVRLLGRRDDVPDLMGAADVFVLSSLWEGLPNVVIEAMAASLAVVATDIAPVREAVDPGNSALLAAAANPSALADAVATVLGDDELRARLGERGREVFLERFTIGPVADAMIELYEQVKLGNR